MEKWEFALKVKRTKDFDAYFFLLVSLFNVVYLPLYHWFSLLLLRCCGQSESDIGIFGLVLIFIDLSVLPSPLLSPYTVYFSLCASCQHWHSATLTLATRLVADTAAAGQGGESNRGITEQSRSTEEGQKGETCREKNKERRLGETTESRPSSCVKRDMVL